MSAQPADGSVAALVFWTLAVLVALVAGVVFAVTAADTSVQRYPHPITTSTLERPYR